MNKTFKLYLVLFAVMLGLLVVLQLGKSEVIDWRKNFDVGEKTPFGLYVFDREADRLFGNRLERQMQSPFDYYSKQKTESDHNILVIASSIDEMSWTKILDQASKGASVMLISEDFSETLSNALKFHQSNIAFEETQTLALTDVKWGADSLALDKLPSGQGFMSIDQRHQILGKIKEKNNTDQANFIKVNYGKGVFYLHSEPLFLTNYYLLEQKGSERYLQDVFSYLPARRTVWFVQGGASLGESNSPMRYILNNPPLRYAWWLFLVGLLVFVFFTAKRKQRVIPVIEPLKNKSLEFVQSIGNLYLQEGDFHDMMAKKSQYFLYRVRQELFLDTRRLDEDFVQKLHLKTGAPTEKIKEAVLLIKKAQDPQALVRREDLGRINDLLDGILNP